MSKPSRLSDLCFAADAAVLHLLVTQANACTINPMCELQDLFAQQCKLRQLKFV
jgi:hypothetical protein